MGNRPEVTDGVRYIHEDNGQITALDLESGVASFGDTKAEALSMLAEALELHEGGGEPIEDEAAFLKEIGIDPDELPDETKELPDFMQ